MKDTLVNHQSTISIGGRSIYNLRFADDVHLLAGSESAFQAPTDSLDKSSTSNGMEITHEKSKILINGNGYGANTSLYGEQLDNVNTFKHIGMMLTENGTSKKEIFIRLAAATVVVVRMENIWKYE